MNLIFVGKPSKKHMKPNRTLARLALAIITIGAATAFTASAATTIYDNTANDLLTRFSPGTMEVGDQIILAGPGSRNLTKFSFEFYGTNTANPTAFAGTINARVRFYLNDGPLFNGYARPGTMF